jgi:hypothetical protein
MGNEGVATCSRSRRSLSLAPTYMLREDALDVRFAPQENPRRAGMSSIQLLRVELLFNSGPKP